jgi:cyclophilin family peptidyl-prolyl cis-trans isomerase
VFVEKVKEYSFPVAVVVIIAAIVFFVFKPADSAAPQESVLSATSSPAVDTNTKKMEKPTMQLDLKKQYSAVLHTTAGDITISFDTQNTPITSNNFIYLAKAGYYNDVIFHRTIPGFMIQGGDPTGTGSGGPGYSFADEYLKGKYTKGTVAMANAGPNTNGSQFFIMHADYDLQNAYVIFGHVTAGLDVVDKIATAATKPGGEGSSPVSPVKITTVDILEK